MQNIFISVLFFSNALAFADDSALFPKTRSEDAGLEMKIEAPAWSKKSEIQLKVAFRWTEWPHGWILNGADRISIGYWNEKKDKILSAEFPFAGFSFDFRRQKTNLLRKTLTVKVPKGCRYIAISFGTLAVIIDVQDVGPF
jgi:hypothetical protein